MLRAQPACVSLTPSAALPSPPPALPTRAQPFPMTAKVLGIPQLANTGFPWGYTHAPGERLPCPWPPTTRVLWGLCCGAHRRGAQTAALRALCRRARHARAALLVRRASACRGWQAPTPFRLPSATRPHPHPLPLPRPAPPTAQ